MKTLLTFILALLTTTAFAASQPRVGGTEVVVANNGRSTNQFALTPSLFNPVASNVFFPTNTSALPPVPPAGQGVLYTKTGSTRIWWYDGASEHDLTSGGISGSNTRVLFFNGDDNPEGDGGLTYDAATDALTLDGALDVGGDFTMAQGMRASFGPSAGGFPGTANLTYDGTDFAGIDGATGNAFLRYNFSGEVLSSEVPFRGIGGFQSGDGTTGATGTSGDWVVKNGLVTTVGTASGVDSSLYMLATNGTHKGDAVFTTDTASGATNSPSIHLDVDHADFNTGISAGIGGALWGILMDSNKFSIHPAISSEPLFLDYARSTDTLVLSNLNRLAVSAPIATFSGDVTVTSNLTVGTLAATTIVVDSLVTTNRQFATTQFREYSGTNANFFFETNAPAANIFRQWTNTVPAQNLFANIMGKAVGGGSITVSNIIPSGYLCRSNNGGLLAGPINYLLPPGTNVEVNVIHKIENGTNVLDFLFTSQIQ